MRHSTMLFPLALIVLGACQQAEEPAAVEQAPLEAHDCGCDAKKEAHEPAIDPMQRHAVSVADRPSVGPDDAPVTMVLFSDFECPYCKRVGSTLAALRDKYPEQLRIVFRQMPLPFHEHADEAARASLAAQRQGAFWPMHDTLFERQRELHLADWVAWAEELGMDSARFERDLTDPEIAKLVDDDVAEARRFGVKGTPSFFVNGRFVVGARPVDELDTVVQQELAYAASFARERGVTPSRLYEAMRATWLDQPVKR